ncbi:hypothetical protein [Haloarcula salina]|uniref:Uncharacterized protein n=1 Tax=Haloarcula salina TaxID=1429914 RepID=A0AA41KL73_9EURY|nr:hypothetical protein [Haloarcula salina]MBV0902604.1 hypothetical protein [Haloarcula salina]
MLRRLQTQGPAVLVPFAWALVALAHLDMVPGRGVLVFHLVVALVVAGFTARSWDEMASGVLRIWRDILLVGLVLTVGGVVGLLVIQVREPFLTVAILGWMAVPAVGLFYTGKRVPEAERVYLAAAGLSALGAAVYAAALFPAETPLLLGGIALALVGQTAGIVTAASR